MVPLGLPNLTPAAFFAASASLVRNEMMSRSISANKASSVTMTLAVMSDDSALAIKSKDGTIVLTGCSHSGICNICKYAKEVVGQKLYSVIGGFHLFKDDPKVVNGTIKYFNAEISERLYPMHCVDFPTLVRFHNKFKFRKYCTGDVLEFEE